MARSLLSMLTSSFRVPTRSFSTLNVLPLSAYMKEPLSNPKISPAALWHAKSLGITLEGIKGTGPKGHILKSDILNQEPGDISNKKEFPVSETSFLLDIPKSSANQSLIKKCIESVTRGKWSFEYKLMPEIGLLQLQMKAPKEEAEKAKNLLKIYLNDSTHLLL